MTRQPSPGFENVWITDLAMADLQRVADRSIDMLKEVLRTLKALDEGRVIPRPLHDFAKTGDLSDCGKLVVEVDGDPEYHIVVKAVTPGSFDVTDVITVEAREDDIAYLISGLRLGRIPDPIRRSDAGRRIARIQKSLDLRGERQERPPG